MSLIRTRLQTMKFAVAEETTENTAATELATSAILPREDGVEFNLDRDSDDTTFMTGSLSDSAPVPTMWSDDIGPSLVPVLARGKGTLTKPEYSVLMKSIFGTENSNTDGTIDTGSDTVTIVMKTGGDPTAGQLVYFPDADSGAGFVSRVVSVTTGTSFDIWPALPDTPSEDDEFLCGTNWQLASSDHPSFTAWGYFDGPKRIRYTGCKTISWEATFEVSASVPMDFVCRALSPLYDYTAQGVTPTVDRTTTPLRCLGIDIYSLLSATATGTPTTTETILSAPDFDVAVGDKILIDVGSDVWETVAISAVSGDAQSNITLTHAAVSVAASADDTVYVQSLQCAQQGDSVTVTLEVETDFQRCMGSTYGKVAQEQVSRTVTIAKTPYFKSWQDFYMRDSVKASALMIVLGDTENNIFAVYVPNSVNTEVSMTNDLLMKLDVTSRGVVDSVLGNDHEIVAAAF
ncbi:hypothetical protein GF380_06465 [Candidatus Uhrbacteria bacterium]|nr:hypothetical protein [Candidatus Uhrbacteria bacterium]